MNPAITNPTKKTIPEMAIAITWFSLLVAPTLVVSIELQKFPIVFHLLLFLAGWLAWTFTEYCQHRFDAHGLQETHGKKSLHHHHHRHPTEIVISVFHRTIFISLSATLVCIAFWLNNYFSLLAGYILGFTGYTFMHWFLHHKISSGIFPELHRFHIHHHCKHPDKCFGITVTWWDHLFGTVPDKNTVISEKILAFYYKKEKKNKTFSLNPLIDEKLSLPEKQSA